MRLILGITGASSVRLATKFSEVSKQLDIELYSVISKAAEKVFSYEDPGGIDTIRRNSKALYYENEMDAPIASSSFPTDGMVIMPCTMNTAAKIAHGISDNLILRAADIQIKMRNKLVLVPRESPLSPIHLRNLYRVSLMGNTYIILPLLTYYHEPVTIEDMEMFTIGKVLDVFGVKHNIYKRWGGGGE